MDPNHNLMRMMGITLIPKKMSPIYNLNKYAWIVTVYHEWKSTASIEFDTKKFNYRAARLEDEFLPTSINVTVASEVENISISILAQPLQVLY
jgi:hypothetical protein